MRIRMTKTISGYVWGGIRLPPVGNETDVPDGCARSLIESGAAVAAAGKSAPIETATAEPETETAAITRKPASRQKRRPGKTSS